jgi:uncharacterized membrane protein
MAAQSEDRTNDPVNEMTLKDLTPPVAGLLCYVAGWISGIVFLVLEQKNRFVRFHALQSIIVFGILTLASSILGNIPLIGTAFSIIIGILAFCFWIILMVKAYQGELFKMPWAGDLAERLAYQSQGQTGPQYTPNPSLPAAQPLEQPQVVYPPRTSRIEEFRATYYSDKARTGRIIGSSFAIVCSVLLLVFFNFYHQYIAYYEPVNPGSWTPWHMHTLVTPDIYLWLPLLTAVLVLSIIGHAFLIAFNKYILHQIVLLVLDSLGVAVVVSLLFIFPFNFNVLPDPRITFGVEIGLKITLSLIAIGLAIGALIRLIRLIVNTAEGKY